MKPHSFLTGLLLLAAAVPRLGAQTGPFPPDNWPATVDLSQRVHFISTDGLLAAPGENWTPDLTILTGGDQVTGEFTIGGFAGLKALGNYFNVADAAYEEWADDETIDILVQAYGDAALFNAAGEPRNFNFLTGVLPEIAFPVGGQVAVEARNRKWNWILFRISNGIRASDGTRHVGSIPANAQGASNAGGVNGGTIRFEGVPNLILRAVAFGPQGAFGEPEAVNVFLPADSCDPEPVTNLAGLDLNAQTSNHLEVINDGDQTVSFVEGVGPENDRRRAVQPTGTYLNFGITGNFLGLPCNDPRAVKVCVEFYDDPAFAGLDVRFGPEAYATDDTGGIAFFPADQRQVLAGSGGWIKRSWIVPAVNLKGVNAGALTAGPRFISENGQVAVSRVDLAVLRIGTHPLAGQDPLADCFADPSICLGLYGNFAELNLATDVRNGLDVGSSGGDQEMIQEEAGPANDRRNAIRPAREDGSGAFAHQYLNFAITEEALGPSSQPNAHLAICVEYYDDPALAGAQFKPEVYQAEVNGLVGLAFTPDSFFVTLEGSDTWRTAYWEIPNMKFLGVNQGPQAAARFVLSNKIFVSRVRYGVLRPCGPTAGQNPLADCVPAVVPTLTATLGGEPVQLELRWPAATTGYTLQKTASLSVPDWQPVPELPVIEGESRVLRISPAAPVYYRLVPQ
ncbi:MAG: hypothetical protein J0L84_07245 [Verrucomicrobia bacterium]|nr:hypothetical protein [Verrucomicrobiota bacterium]